MIKHHGKKAMLGELWIINRLCLTVIVYLDETTELLVISIEKIEHKMGYPDIVI